MRLFFSIIVASVGLSSVAFATAKKPSCKDQLVIISPHPKSIQDEFVRGFKQHYKTAYNCEIEMDSLYQGGASDVLRLVLGRFEQNPKNPASGFDVFWGGGEHPHYELDRRQLLQPFSLSASLKKEVPVEVAGVKL